MVGSGVQGGCHKGGRRIGEKRERDTGKVPSGTGFEDLQKEWKVADVKRVRGWGSGQPEKKGAVGAQERSLEKKRTVRDTTVKMISGFLASRGTRDEERRKFGNA